MIGKNIKSIGEILSVVISPEKIAEKNKEMKILNEWENIVGKKISKYSKPKSIKKNILTIDVKGSSWIQEVYFKSKEIKEEINKLFGYEKIKNLKIKSGTDRI